LALVHNGIIEKLFGHQRTLTGTGFTFKSETGYEVLVRSLNTSKVCNKVIRTAVRMALSGVIGSISHRAG
jgi:glucosamine--fructose-6-phosphate aminotransferase (isomerizing)